MQENKKLLGAFGEDAACRYLVRCGYRIVGRNYASRFGEIDIIARKGRYIVFAEVKLRRDASHGAAAEFVTGQKQRRIILAAQQWLAANPTALQPRFDVIEVYAPQGLDTAKPQINHLEDAYST